MVENTATERAPAPTGSIALWPADVLDRNLRSDDAIVRTVALGMAVQPGAPVDRCVDALAACAGQVDVSDTLASQLAATALGSLPAQSANEAVYSRLAGFAAEGRDMPVRIAAAHAIFRLACLPPAAQDALCTMLLDPDGHARKVALLAVRPFAKAAAGTIARHVAAAEPARWTVEALQALAGSAGDDKAACGKVEAFLMRSLAGAPLVSAGIAGYASLARLHQRGPAVAALVQIAGDVGNREASGAALEALGELGESAQPAAKSVAQMLAQTDDPAREELLCRTLVRLRPAAKDVPIARVLQRVQSAPDRGTAAHCMLLCLHPREFAQAATVVKQRFEAAGEALRQALRQTYKTLTGTELTSGAVAGKA